MPAIHAGMTVLLKHLYNQETLSVGVYPVTGLADARRKAEEAHTNVANGIDSSGLQLNKIICAATPQSSSMWNGIHMHSAL